MLSLDRPEKSTAALADHIRADIRAYLYESFAREDGVLADLDRWTQRRISGENLAKAQLALESGDPTEYSYQNLIREIDTEARAGVFLANPGTVHPVLGPLVGESGISGTLHEHIEQLAPRLFGDEFRHSDGNLDLVWVTLRARHDRAVVDAGVSGIVLKHLAGNTNGTRDMLFALRSLLYAFHEDGIRRQFGLPPVLTDTAVRDLVVMVSELVERAGDYGKRVRAIEARAEAAQGSP
jgi:hypothetical protein